MLKSLIIMRIGYACIPLRVDYKTTRKTVLKKFREEKFINLVSENLRDLKHILEYNISNHIFLFRISSDIIPFGSHLINNIEWKKLFARQLQEIGDFIKRNKIRVSMHPGQYTVLNSPKKEVLENSIRDIEYHCNFLDSLSLDYTHKIVIHLGGEYGDKSAALKRFINNFYLLSDSAKKRLVIENDEKIFNIDNILQVSMPLGIPAIFDYFHHTINPTDQSLENIMGKVSSTWKESDGPVKIHYSEQSPFKKKGSHSEFIEIEKFLSFYNKIKDFKPDIMLETKDKDISASKCINALFNNTKNTIYDEWARYKYLVMERSYAFYKECSEIINLCDDVIDLYKKIDSALLQPYDEKNFLNTLLHVWGYLSDIVTESEKKSFFTLIDKGESKKAKLLAYRLADKYEVTYLKKSYYFIYDKIRTTSL